MLFLHKLLPMFFLPLGLTFILLLIGVIWRRRWPIAAALALLYVSSIGAVSGPLLGWLESRYPAIPLKEVGKADAIVVLGGIFGPPAKPGCLPNLSESVERLEAGIVLKQAGAAPWLVFTGGRIPWEGREKVEGEDSRDAAIARGVPAEQIVVTREVGNTADEAQAVADLMRTRGWKKIILVTTGWHMPRAAWLFRKAGIECRIFPVDFWRDASKPWTLLDFLPNAGSLANTETALREIYGNLYYRLLR